MSRAVLRSDTEFWQYFCHGLFGSGVLFLDRRIKKIPIFHLIQKAFSSYVQYFNN